MVNRWPSSAHRKLNHEFFHRGNLTNLRKFGYRWASAHTGIESSPSVRNTELQGLCSKKYGTCPVNVGALFAQDDSDLVVRHRKLDRLDVAVLIGGAVVDFPHGVQDVLHCSCDVP